MKKLFLGILVIGLLLNTSAFAAKKWRQKFPCTEIFWQLLTGKGGISPTEAGFDTYCVWNTPKTARERYWNPSYESDGKILTLPKDTYGPDVMTDFMIDFITGYITSNIFN
jgi:hypothetical protein